METLTLDSDLIHLLNQKNQQLMSKGGSQFPSVLVEEALEQLDSIAMSERYQRLSECVREKLAGASGIIDNENTKVICLKYILVKAIERFPRKYSQSEIRMPLYTPNLYMKEFRRILTMLDDESRDVWGFNNDIFCKELAICCAHLIPVSCQVVCVSGVPRRTLFLKPLHAFFKKLYYFCCKHNGFGPTFEIHMHLENKRYFGPTGRDQCYKVVADLLVLNPEFKGLQASSWFYDINLKQISPPLAYLADTPIRHGAVCFYVCDEDASSGALKTSTTRKQLYQKSEYQPKTYLLSWPKKELLRYTAKLEFNFYDPE